MTADLFRKEALEARASQEPMDELLSVVTPAMWAAWGATALLVTFTLVWGFLGSIPTTVQGRGIMLRSELRDVVSLGRGNVTQIGVEPGDHVESGQVVAWVDQPELENQITEQRKLIQDLMSHHQALEAFGVRDMNLRIQNLQAEIQSLNSTVDFAETRRSWLAERVSKLHPLHDQGLVTRQEYLDARIELDGVVSEIANLQQQIHQNQRLIFQVGHDHEQQVFESRLALENARRDLVLL